MGNVGKGAAVDDGGVVFQRLNEVRVKGILEQRGHGTGGTDVACRDGLALVGVGADDLRQPLLQVGDAGGQAEDRHDLAGNGDIKAVLTGGTVHLAAQAIHDEAELAVVHIHAALPGDAAGIDVQGVALLDAVVDHGSQQVICGANGMQVTGKVEVDILHGHHLGIAAAGRAALYAEHGPERGLAQRHDGAAAYLPQRVREADGGRGLSLARRGGVYGGDEDELAVLPRGLEQGGVYLGLVPAVALDEALVDAGLGGDFGYGQGDGCLGNFNIGHGAPLYVKNPFYFTISRGFVKLRAGLQPQVAQIPAASCLPAKAVDAILEPQKQRRREHEAVGKDTLQPQARGPLTGGAGRHGGRVASGGEQVGDRGFT